MRLLNVKSLKFAEFRNHNRPKYVIASHRWIEGCEVTLRDVRDRMNKDRSGYRKIMDFANYIKEHVPEVEWLWIDTCCIDKTNAAELSESLNLMFDWNRDAVLCIAYLADVEVAEDRSAFARSEWFKRGWTLQELLASRLLVFVTESWQVIGNKGASTYMDCRTPTGPGLEEDIAAITRIPERVLHDFGTSYELSVDERMKWMEGRHTTRGEDMSYALYGIFGVHLGANYGEGYTRARQRLLAGIRENSSWNGELQYHPLANPYAGTRILNILDVGEQHSPIRCSISHITLDDPPDFTALSYHWGEYTASQTILIQTIDALGDRDVKFPVTVNLENALRELGRRGIFSVWVDTLCINQKDVSERSQQVAIMGNIYAAAAKVVGWIGLACDSSTTAVNSPLPGNRDPSIAISGSTSEMESPMILQQIRDFLSRPYFTRIWIIQELAKARSAELWYGQDTLGLDDFNTFVLSNHAAKMTSNQKILFEAIRLFCMGERQAKMGKSRMLLSQALIASRFSKASDPRDKIFALLGLVRDGNDIVPAPDYRKSAKDIFAAASKYMIGSQRQVSLILLARGSNSPGKYPSWIPDWNDCTQLPPWIEDCLNREHNPWMSSCRVTGNTLSVLGYVMDEVYQHLSQYDDDYVGVRSDVESRAQYFTMQDWAERFVQDPEHICYKPHVIAEHTSADSSARSKSQSRETELLALASGVQQMTGYSMRLARFKHRGFRFAHQDVRDGDQMWRLECCPLPVVLRPISENRFSFVGELYVDTRKKEWCESTWNDLGTCAGELCSAEWQNDASFQMNKSKRIQLE